jgi:hypothetical protein
VRWFTGHAFGFVLHGISKQLQILMRANKISFAAEATAVRVDGGGGGETQTGIAGTGLDIVTGKSFQRRQFAGRHQQYQYTGARTDIHRISIKKQRGLSQLAARLPVRLSRSR